MPRRRLSHDFRTFASSIERGGKLIYFDGDPVVKQLAQGVREDITAMPYDQHVVVEKEGKTYLQIATGIFLSIFRTASS